MRAEAHIGVDVGGGGIRVRAKVGDHHLTTHDDGPVPRTAGRIDTRALGERIGRLVAGLDVDAVDRVAVGLTGMPGLLDRPEELGGQLHRHIATSGVIVASDALATHLGALAGRPGCVVAAGTGVIVLGTDHRTTWHQADGWGHLLGDDGGGAWIGAQGLRAALRHADGRDGGSAALLAKATSRFGGIDGSLHTIYGSTWPARELATFAPDVAAAAHDGDRVAGDIWRRAGVHLAESAQAAARDLPANFSWGGRLFDAGPLLHDAFHDELSRRVPGARIVTPAGQAADGALLLAQRGLPPDSAHPAAYAVEIPDPDGESIRQ
ncbi:N-acetylglucosamine kinase [Actinophytocola sediminis]